jgi:Arm DNA-binding domain
VVEQIVRRVCVSAARGTKGRLLMTIHKFTARFVETAKDGMYCDGGNLWLQVRNGGKARAYLFRYTSPVTGAERSMGLGSARTISLAEVREAAHRQHQFLRDGKDPIEVAKIERLERDAKTGGNSSMISHARAGALACYVSIRWGRAFCAAIIGRSAMFARRHKQGYRS